MNQAAAQQRRRLRMDLNTDETSGLRQRRLDRSRESRLNDSEKSATTLKPHIQCGFFNVVTLARFGVLAFAVLTPTIKHINLQGM